MTKVLCVIFCLLSAACATSPFEYQDMGNGCQGKFVCKDKKCEIQKAGDGCSPK